MNNDTFWIKRESLEDLAGIEGRIVGVVLDEENDVEKVGFRVVYE